LNDLNKQFKYFSKLDMPKFIIFIVTWITNLNNYYDFIKIHPA